MTGTAPLPEMRGGKPPPLLMLAVLLFWGWQSGFLIVGTIMGVVLESARFIKVRLELSDTDFRRIVNFCTLFTLATMLYVFTATPATAGGAMEVSSLRASTSFLQWQPMFLFVFVVAQTFSTREKIPLTAISLISRWRSRQDQKNGETPAGISVNISYPYFIVCLFSASFHANSGTNDYFWGQSILLAWALWPLRSRRFGISVWLCLIMVSAGIGFCGQYGIGQAQHLIEGYSTQWMERFYKQRTDASHDVTAIGEIGRLKLSARIIIRLKLKNGCPPPAYLREASYRSYHSRNWYAGGSPKDFVEVPQDFTSGNWNLLPEKTNGLAVNIACYLDGRSPDTGDLEGLLPLPAGSRRLENLPALTLKKSKTGAVLATGQKSLMMFDALYDPGATIDSPPDTNWDNFVPANEVPALDRVISEMKISGASDAQKILAVRQFFHGKFAYSTWLGPDKLAHTNETSLGRFLLDSRSGHCEYFATATVLLLRELGIPARYAVGYYVHENSGRGFVVRERDAHAWCLVWDKSANTWKDFDTTPDSWVAIEGQRASFLEWFSDSWSWVRFEIPRFEYWRSRTNSRQYVFWALIPVMAWLLFQMAFRHGRKHRLQKKNKTDFAPVSWPGLDSEFYLFETKLIKRGVPRDSGETLSDWLARTLGNPALADLRMPLRGLLQLHYRYRFDPRGLSSKEREALAHEAKICL
ncbi:MAG TPA: transglutaminase domain-containing protein, partial [Candidatus Acidoferrum sp.]|nr:transglutaminase domain-containing protein [Candidatus Acidoferrum sp.]